MRVLWITNTIFPDASKAIGNTIPVTGGWMYGLANRISEKDDVEIAVATDYPGEDFKDFDVKGIRYFLLPGSVGITYPKFLEDYWKKVVELFKPDIIHIHGSEYPRGLSCINVCPNYNYVLSIQGMPKVYYRYFMAGLTTFDVVKNITIRDILRNDTLFQSRNKFRVQGKYEINYLSKVSHIIGRTDWDYAHVKSINSEVNYHFNNESLRDEFYSAKKWNLNNVERHTIFLSQAGNPLKGLHKVIEAAALVRKDFPDIKIVVGGHNIIKYKSFGDKIRLSGYGSYVRGLIKKYKLWDSIVFKGSLNATEMIEQYKKSHVFVCPSSIENSPNSLGEAQILGVPTVSAYVGGTNNMISHGKDGLLYRFEEVEMLAQHLIKIFTNDQFAQNLSENGVRIAEERHDRAVNTDALMEIYNKIVKNK